MEIKEFTQAVLKSRVVRVWESRTPEPNWMSMGTKVVGQYLLLGDDKSIRELLESLPKPNPYRGVQI